MTESIITNYFTKFDIKQMDYQEIVNETIFFNIYNNKINQPLQKFWFSISNIKFCDSYDGYKTIRLFANNKTKEMSELSIYLKDILTNLQDKIKNCLNKEVEIETPWKERENYPYLFTFRTNNETLIIDNDKNNIGYETLNKNDNYSIIFEISNLKINRMDNLGNIKVPSIKMNFSLLLIKLEPKRDLRNFLFKSLTNNINHVNYNENKIINNEKINKQNIFDAQPVEFKLDPNILKNGLNALRKTKNKPVDIIVDNENKISDDDNEFFDNESEANQAYTTQKNNLKKVETNIKGLSIHEHMLIEKNLSNPNFQLGINNDATNDNINDVNIDETIVNKPKIIKKIIKRIVKKKAV